jgi:hypothetical protein
MARPRFVVLLHRLGEFAQTIDHVHHDGVAGIAAGFREGTISKRVLVEERTDGVLEAGAGVRGPALGIAGAAFLKCLDQLDEGGSDLPGLQFLVDLVEIRGAEVVECEGWG